MFFTATKIWINTECNMLKISQKNSLDDKLNKA